MKTYTEYKKEGLKQISKLPDRKRPIEWIVLVLLIAIVLFTMPLLVPVPLFFIAFLIYEDYYFKSASFQTIKDALATNTAECNALNSHIQELKEQYHDIDTMDYGVGIGQFQDYSRYNYQRKADTASAPHIHDCSLSVLRNARNRPFKYICKYFNVKTNEESLAQFEAMLNAFSAIEQGKELLNQERTDIMTQIAPKIPLLYSEFRKKKFEQMLGLEKIDFSDVYMPRYGFRYISAGGNKAESYTIMFNINTLDRFVVYLSELTKFRKSIKGQRALMTTSLRTKIKERDNYTCCICHASIVDEPHLLLEIDHIVPLAKGGMTTEDNLQTLCWRCNRSKGAKVIN